MSMKWKQYLKAFVIGLNCLVIFFMVYVIAASAGYTVLLGDDFCTGTKIGLSHSSFFQYFVMALQYMKQMYMDWQGCYFAMFIQALLSPVNGAGLEQLRIIMIGNALLFFCTLFGVVWTAFDFVMKEKKMPYVRLTVFSIILFSILDARVFTEIFFWYTGAVGYNFPFSFLLISISFFLLSNNDRYAKKMKNFFTVSAAVFFFLASGGSLAVTGTGCYIILLLVLGFYLASGQISIRNIVIAAVGLAGALINVAAPGNYVRQEWNNGGGGFSLLINSVKWAVKNICAETERLIRETMFGVMLIAMILIGIYLAKKLKTILKVYGIISVLALGTGFVTAFPVVFGYGGSELPIRCYFIFDVALIISLLNLALFIGCCLDCWANLHENKSACAVLLIVFATALMFSPEALSESSLIAIAEFKHNGTYNRYYDECCAIYYYLETCPEEEVVIAMPAYIENFECFYFDDDETAWVNVGLAEYYHKKSVKRKNE